MTTTSHSSETGGLFPRGMGAAGGPGSASDARLVDAYVRVARTLDDLPYTDDFEEVYVLAGGDAVWGGRRAAFRRLHTLRKAAKLPTLGRARVRPIRVSTEEEQTLAALVVASVGTLGQRDQLVYDPALEAVVQEFNATTGRDLDPHAVWRLIARLAK